MIGQLVKNRDTGRLGIVKRLLMEGRAVITRCNDAGIPTRDKYRSGIATPTVGIWISSLDKWEPVTAQQPPSGQMFLFT